MTLYDSIEDAANAYVPAGALVFCDSPDLVGKAIRAGQWIKWRRTCRWNHVAVTLESGINPTIAQATVNGVTIDKHLSDLEGGPIAIIIPTAKLSADDIVTFAKSQNLEGYGYLTLFGIVVDQLSPRWLRFQIGKWGTWICSALAGECWRFGGWLWPWPCVYAVSPAELALAVGMDEQTVYKQRTSAKQRRMH